MAHKKLQKQEAALRKDMSKQHVKQLKLANIEEDKTIRKLEKMLGLNKNKEHKGKKRIPKMFNDGLDYALELCDSDNLDKMYAFVKGGGDGSKVSDSEWNEDFDLATGKVSDLAHGESDLSDADSEFMGSDQELDQADSELEEEDDDELSGDESDEDQEDIEDDEDDEDDEIDSMGDSDDEAPEELTTVTSSSKKRKLSGSAQVAAAPEEDSENDDSSGEFDDLDESDEEETGSDGSATPAPKPDVWEDIYGRKRDKDGNVLPATADTGKYIPPHLRAKLAAAADNGVDDEDPDRRQKLQRLKRILKGLLNRLSEANMHKITNEIENMYMSNPRNDMNSTLSALIFDAIVSHALSPDRMVMEHALLLAALHANVGSEVGANMLEKLVDRFHLIVASGIDQADVGDKTLDNVVFLLCHMYTFKVSG